MITISNVLKTTVSFTALCGLASAAAQAQVASVVSVCSGVSLPRSVVTDIVRDPLLGIVNPIQNTVNNILGVVGIVPIVGEVFPQLNIDVSGLLNNAASGAPINLAVLDNNGTIIGPSDQCNTIADSYQLNTQGGISIGGNRITGLGTNGLDAVAGEAGSIAFGNNATTSLAATNSIALGTGASAVAANGIALGAGSVADRAAAPSYAAFGLAAPQSSAGSVSVGAAGAERQITNVAAGSAPTDAVNVAQLAAVSTSAVNAVQYDLNGGGDRINRVTLTGGASGPVAIGNVADGVIAAGSSEAVTGSQLFSTNSQIATNTTNIATNTTNIAGNTASITNLTNGTAGLVQQAGGAPGVGQLTVGAATGGANISVAGTDGNRIITGVAAGSIGADSVDAVNGAQLFATNTAVTNNSNGIALNTASIINLNNGTAGLLQQVGGAPGAGQLTVGAATGGTNISVAGTDGNRTITGVAAGIVADGSTDAVNGAQLFATNTTITNNGNSITNIINGAAGLVQQVGGAPGAGALTVGAATGGTVVDFTGTSGARILSGVAAGVASTDAVNVGQIAAISAAAANAVQYDVDGSGNRTNTVTLTGGTAGRVVVANVGDGDVTAGSGEAVNGGQLFATNSAVTTNTANIATNTVNITNLTNGTAGLVQQVGGAPGSGQLTIGATTGGTVIAVAGADGNRVVSGVAAGAAAAGSSEAVNGGQLFATNMAVTNNSAAINANSSAITSLTNDIDSGTRGLVQQVGGAPGSGLLTVGVATGGTGLSIAGTDGTRVLSGLSNGVAGSDAATVAQLAQVTGGALNAVNYDTDALGGRTNSITLIGGTAEPVRITNLADGAVAAGSADAVTGSQLAATNASVAANTLTISQTGSTVNSILQGQAGAFRSDNTAAAAAPAASGINSTAGGFGAVASGVQSVALGNNAVASGANSVAIGYRSSDGGESNVVSVGAPTQLRRVTNVGPAINSTDAINLGQLQAATGQIQQSFTQLQGQISGLQFDLRDVRRRGNAGTAGALALAGLPQAFTSGKGMIAAAIGQFEGEVAFAFGASKIIGDQTVLRAGGTFSARGPKGFNAGVGYQF